MSDNEKYADGDASYMPLIDVRDALGRLMNNRGLYIQLLRGFKGGEMAADISNAVNAGDYEKIIYAAHKLKGVAANLGLTRLRDVSLKMESGAKIKESADALKALEAELLKIVEATMAAAGDFCGRAN